MRAATCVVVDCWQLKSLSISTVLIGVGACVGLLLILLIVGLIVVFSRGTREQQQGAAEQPEMQSVVDTDRNDTMQFNSDMSVASYVGDTIGGKASSTSANEYGSIDVPTCELRSIAVVF